MAPIRLILLCLAAVCFLLATVGVAHSRINLIGAGLTALTLSFIIGDVSVR